jgi:hypothetical protein
VENITLKLDNSRPWKAFLDLPPSREAYVKQSFGSHTGMDVMEDRIAI